jgi:hypothetical protein
VVTGGCALLPRVSVELHTEKHVLVAVFLERLDLRE